MLTDVIRMFGFEDTRTIDFAKKCEEWKKPVVNTNTYPVAAMTTAATTYKANERVHYENILYRCV